MPAYLIGSIGTLVETSDLQRDAFNRAFAEAGLDWHWETADYAAMLALSGGRDRIARYANQRGETVDAEAIHARKSALFQERLAEGGLSPRPGVIEALEAARAAGWKTGFVTTTSAANVDAILAALGMDRRAFDIVTDAGLVERGKPAPDVYLLALERLGESAEGSIAVEDNPDGVRAAKAAGLTCTGFPGALHSRESLAQADTLVDHLRPPQAA